MPIKKFKNFILLVFILSFCFLVFGLVTAADEPVKINFKPNYPWGGEKSPAGLVARFYQIALGLAGAAALGVLIYGAILWTVSGAVTGKQDALEWIKGALWGLVLLLGAYLILWTINPDLVNLKNPAMEFISLPSSSETSTSTVVNCYNVSPGNCENFKECELQVVIVGSNKCVQKTGTKVEGGVVGRTIKEESGRQEESRSVYSCVTRGACVNKGGTVISSLLCQTRTDYALNCNVGGGEVCCEAK